MFGGEPRSDSKAFASGQAVREAGLTAFCPTVYGEFKIDGSSVYLSKDQLENGT